MAASLILSEVQPHRHDAIGLADLGLVEIVLGHGHIGLLHATRLPGRQAHVRAAAVGALGDQLGGGLAGDGEMQLVLDEAEELGGFRQRRRVVGRHRKDLANAPVHPALARPDVADALQQLVETVGRGRAGDRRILQVLVVQGEALDQILAQAFGGPAAKLRAAQRSNPVTHGHDGL